MLLLLLAEDEVAEGSGMCLLLQHVQAQVVAELQSLLCAPH
jgi:hypothetical protein